MLNINLPYESEIPLLGIYPKDMKKCLHKGLYANVQMFIEAFIIMAKNIIQISMNWW